MPATPTLSDDLLQQARLVGGQIESEFDRQTHTSDSMPFYSVVGKNSKDSSYRGLMNGKSVEVSRAGEFRRGNGEEGHDYFTELELIVIDARAAYTLFENNKVVARGISTRGFSDAVWTDGRFPPGTPIETSPYNRFYWDKNGGKEGKVYSDDGKLITREDLATCSLQLWCYDPGKDEFCIVQFSAGALRHYREFVRGIETQGVKMHALLWKLTTDQVSNGDAVAPSFVPHLEPVRVLSPGEFEKMDVKRIELVAKATALALTGEIATTQKSLPVAAAITNPPIEADPDDVFAGIA